jgi:hypothetical protein
MYTRPHRQPACSEGQRSLQHHSPTQQMLDRVQPTAGRRTQAAALSTAAGTGARPQTTDPPSRCWTGCNRQQGGASRQPPFPQLQAQGRGPTQQSNPADAGQGKTSSRRAQAGSRPLKEISTAAGTGARPHTTVPPRRCWTGYNQQQGGASRQPPFPQLQAQGLGPTQQSHPADAGQGTTSSRAAQAGSRPFHSCRHRG